ncbi:MAG: hypothetical protein JWP89_455 [Schlesneria sp.]|nr:hypothetical protein [Schlesneria sp.]
MKTREEFPDWLVDRGYLRIAEIGVAAGDFARQILSRWVGAYTMVDLWAHLPQGDFNISKVTDAEHERNFKQARRVAAEFAPRVQMLRLSSVDAAKCFPDEYFDVVYLDASHSYEAVLADLTAWLPKIRKGGAFAGHDFLDGLRPEGDFGVKKAVTEFFGRDPEIVTKEAWPTWIVDVGGNSETNSGPQCPHINLRPIRVEPINERNALLHVQVATAKARLSNPPDDLSGRGIVICGGGKYAASAWVTAKVLRQLGCQLPIQVWHLGPEEISPLLSAALASIDAESVDAHRVAELFPHPRLFGWELKAFALLHCPWREVMLLDADNIPLRDVTNLFDDPQYLQHGSLFWPDRGRFAPDNKIWKLTGLTYRDEAEFESGQMLIDRRRCWRELVLSNWFNEESEFWYQHMHGDKDTFRLGWRLLDTAYNMIPFAGTAPWPLFYQKNGAEEVIFHHGYKWQQPASKNERVVENSPLIPLWERCREYMDQFEVVTTGVRSDHQRIATEKRSNIVVLQFGNGVARDMLNVTEPIHQAACARYGYDFVVEYLPKLPRHACWEKVRMVKDAIDKGYEHIVWIDADALWLGDRPLLDCWENAPQDAWLAATYHDAPGSGPGHHYDHFNLGVIFLRNRTEFVREFVKKWLDAPDENHPWREQHAFHSVVPQHREQFYALDHAWNSVQWLSQYRAQEPHIVAWHGQGHRAYGEIRQYAEKYRSTKQTQ